jgi:hypothetical protein
LLLVFSLGYKIEMFRNSYWLRRCSALGIWDIKISFPATIGAPGTEVNDSMFHFFF